MFDKRDYDGCDPEREDRLARERESIIENAAREVRLQAHYDGLCSLRAALDGGADYERDLADAALELAEAGIGVNPVHAALAGWRKAVAA